MQDVTGELKLQHGGSLALKLLYPWLGLTPEELDSITVRLPGGISCGVRLAITKLSLALPDDQFGPELNSHLIRNLFQHEGKGMILRGYFDLDHSGIKPRYLLVLALNEYGRLALSTRLLPKEREGEGQLTTYFWHDDIRELLKADGTNIWAAGMTTLIKLVVSNPTEKDLDLPATLRKARDFAGLSQPVAT